jgi:hypothetical protein
MSGPIDRAREGVMKSRGGPYAGTDVPEFLALVEELFTPEEAQVNNTAKSIHLRNCSRLADERQGWGCKWHRRSGPSR